MTLPRNSDSTLSQSGARGSYGGRHLNADAVNPNMLHCGSDVNRKI